MTINNTANKVVAAGNGVMTVFNFSFVGIDASDIAVIYTDASGNETTLATTAYSLTLNAAPPGQIWGIGGTVTYPLVGSPIALDTTLTILRTVPLLQKIALGNQGNEFPSAVETALDLLTMAIQQVNETFQRALVAPVTDPSAPLPLPSATERANQALLFDSLGNPIAGAIPASGIISTAMQPVVDAVTLALGRAAFGLGNMATEGIGAGLQDDGSGNARVIFAVQSIASNQNIDASSHLIQYNATGPITLTLDRANTLFDGFGFWLNVKGWAVTLAVNANDTVNGYSSGQSVIIPTGTWVYISTDAATSGTWLLDWALTQGPPMAGGSFAGLSITNNAGTPNSKIDVSATELVLPGTIGGSVRTANPSFTINCSVNGVNGLDTGTLAASTWYYIWAISDGATVAGLTSLSATAPTLPAGYVYAKRIGAILTDGSINFYRFLQKGNRTKYVVTPATNTPMPRAIINQSGGIGNPATPTYVSYALGGFIPPTASIVHLQTMATLPNGAVFLIAPNGNYGNDSSTNNMPPITSSLVVTGTLGTTGGGLWSLMLETQNIFVAWATASGGNLGIAADGWTDNL